MDWRLNPKSCHSHLQQATTSGTAVFCAILCTCGSASTWHKAYAVGQKFKGRASNSLSSDRLVEKARTELLMCMVDGYAAIVITCLTCLDPGNEDFGDEEYMKDDDGVMISVRFIERVLLRLNGIFL